MNLAVTSYSAFSMFDLRLQEGIFIENMTEGMIFIVFAKMETDYDPTPFYVGEKKILYFQDYRQARG